MGGMGEFRLRASDISYVGSDLSRPECVVGEPDGTLWVSDRRGLLTRVGADGEQRTIGKRAGLPNGVALDRGGSFLIADIEDGCLYRMDRSGRREVVLDRLDGKPLGAVNFVYLDDNGRTWVAVSTTTEPRSRAVWNVIPDGYLLLIDSSGVRRMTGGLRFTNEVRIRGGHIYVAETSVGCVARFALRADGSLGAKEIFGPEPLFDGAKVDGIAFDADGNLWVTEITRNGLHVIEPDGTASTVFEDPEGLTVKRPTSVAFGGPDLRTAYVGSIEMDRIASFRAPVPGAPMYHWRDRQFLSTDG